MAESVGDALVVVIDLEVLQPRLQPVDRPQHGAERAMAAAVVQLDHRLYDAVARDQWLDQPHADEHQEHYYRRDRDGGIGPCPASNADGRGQPDRGGCGEAPDAGSLSHDRAGTQETDPARDLGCEARRVDIWAAWQVAKSVRPGNREHGGTHCNQHMGANTGRMAANLAFQTEKECRAGCRQNPERQVEYSEVSY